jgi:hypothetical protein
MLLNLPKEVKREMMRPVCKDLKADRVESDESRSIPENVGYILPALYNSIIIFLFVGMAGAQIGQQFNCEAYNNKFQYLNTWGVNARVRACYVVELRLFGWLNVFSFNPETQQVNRTQDDIIYNEMHESSQG